ncbi:hypothetical protein HDV00_000525 [Rhizophlyctis rosea]|nr:hypothetical protein HDV00_000525 [Rhizophlyctis rosea]
MESLSTRPAFQTFASTVAILFIKMISLSYVQVYGRFRYKSFPHKTDAKAFKATHSTTDPITVQNASAAWRNDLENIPIFCFLALAYLILTVKPGISILSEELLSTLFHAFTGARIVHSLAMVAGAVQPWRFFGFLISQVVCWVLAGSILLKVYIA